ncbi:Zn-ribbon domain-containing OB-fold protein [Vreelandella titanicae]|uniref:DNA-binding protein n=1 Tax=Vreelandella titanicae TaxID=664683 RepID=A0AAP9NT04_9GAMM|nr:OB-fold domain-containing protein [Halomonas titanicae]QKS26767.1 hypothetical protein FX987_04583 [Halomonas titanicae]
MNHILPVITAETRPFWEGCETGILKYQMCTQCETVQVIPRTLCSECHSQELSWQVSSGEGVVVSHTTVYRAPLPLFKESVPYQIVLVDMKEGFRLMANTHGDTSGIAIGEPCRVAFTEFEGVGFPCVEAADE